MLCYTDRYNYVTSSGWEFYTALKGLDYDERRDFLRFIIGDVLRSLVRQEVITRGEGDEIRSEITKNGIAFIPIYYDPIQYYRSIEEMRNLLIAA